MTRLSTHPTTISKFWLCLLRVLFALVLCVLFACVFLRRSYATHTTRTTHNTARTARTTRTTHHTPHIHARQAGGVCRESDWGLLAKGGFQPFEIKGSCRKGSIQTTFTFKDIWLQGTHWKHLFLLGWVREPATWLCVRDVEACVSLGHVSRADYIRALNAAGRSRHRSHDTTVTPASVRDWLSVAVRCTPLEHLTVAWWDWHVLAADRLDK